MWKYYEIRNYRLLFFIWIVIHCGGYADAINFNSEVARQDSKTTGTSDLVVHSRFYQTTVPVSNLAFFSNGTCRKQCTCKSKNRKQTASGLGCKRRVAQSQVHLKSCNIHVQEIEAKYNAVLQKFYSLEERYKYQEHSFNVSISKHDERLMKLKEEIRQLKKERETERDRIRESMSARTALENELRDYRREASRTYVNTTLILEHVFIFISRHLNQLSHVHQRHRSRRFESVIQRKRVKIDDFLRKCDSYINIRGVYKWLTSNGYFKKGFRFLNNLLEGTELTIVSIFVELIRFIMRKLNIDYLGDGDAIYTKHRDHTIALALYHVHEHCQLIAKHVMGLIMAMTLIKTCPKIRKVMYVFATLTLVITSLL